MKLNFFWIALSYCSSIFVLATISISQATQKENAYGNEQCVDCHQQSAKQWSLSDHALAMAVANEASVLGDFSNQQAKHYEQTATFFKKDNQFFVNVAHNKNEQEYQIKYTFGHYPLQQYLVEISQGQFQILPFAWDSREKSEEGQRWYHLYNDEAISPNDRLHWRQPLQSWNGMCADCHSDGLVRDYDSHSNKFDTKWDNINVGCLSCHGKKTAEHDQKNKAKTDEKNKIGVGHWLRSPDQHTARWQGDKRDNAWMDNCFSCHSLRSPLTDGFITNQPFFDQFTPTLLKPPLYYSDGQIKDEVYVYGSFLQSKMFKNGVDCLDCHDKHTMRLKIEGNGLCLQCHSNTQYDTQKHHGHERDTQGAQCVDCHMPTNNYMGVDDRRDHSFKIPRPDLSLKTGAPNACISCHQDQSNQWASDELVKWHGQPNVLSTTRTQYMALHQGHQISLAAHLAIVADETIDEITRATALSMLINTTATLTAVQLSPYLSDPKPLIQLGALRASVLLSVQDKLTHVAPLLNATYRAIRVEAARVLVTGQMATANIKGFAKAFRALTDSYATSSWRGEGRLNQSLIDVNVGHVDEAIVNLRQSITIDPYFEAAYVNLAQIFHHKKQPDKVENILRNGLTKLPISAPLHYAYGLHLIRQKALSEALVSLKQAMNLQPNQSQYTYTYLLALDGTKETKKALSLLIKKLPKVGNNRQLIELGFYFCKKLNDRQTFEQLKRLSLKLEG